MRSSAEVLWVVPRSLSAYSSMYYSFLPSLPSLVLSGRSRSGVMDDIKDIFLTIPDTFRSYGRRSKLNGGPGIFSPSPVSPLSPWSPLNPLSPISPISQISRLTPGDPLGPVSRAQVGAVDAISRRLTDLFSTRKGARQQWIAMDWRKESVYNHLIHHSVINLCLIDKWWLHSTVRSRTRVHKPQQCTFSMKRVLWRVPGSTGYGYAATLCILFLLIK